MGVHGKRIRTDGGRAIGPVNIWPDFHISRNLCSRIDDGCGMDFRK